MAPLSAAAQVLAAARARALTFAIAESLTGGALCAELTAVPGASETVRGGVVAYQVDVKSHVLGVSGQLLAAQGPVCDDVALAMADGVRALMGAAVGVATTGVAGPDAHGGKPAGRVHIAVVSSMARVVREYDFAGDRTGVVGQACSSALELLKEHMLITPLVSRRDGEQL